jgi:hypothetical protein
MIGDHHGRTAGRQLCWSQPRTRFSARTCASQVFVQEVGRAFALRGALLGLKLHPPRPDHPVADLSNERIRRRRVPGDLINEYERAA